MFLDYDTVVSYSSARDHSSDVERGHNLEAETEAEARATRPRPRLWGRGLCRGQK